MPKHTTPPKKWMIHYHNTTNPLPSQKKSAKLAWDRRSSRPAPWSSTCTPRGLAPQCPSISTPMTSGWWFSWKILWKIHGKSHGKSHGKDDWNDFPWIGLPQFQETQGNPKKPPWQSQVLFSKVPLGPHRLRLFAAWLTIDDSTALKLYGTTWSQGDFNQGEQLRKSSWLKLLRLMFSQCSFSKFSRRGEAFWQIWPLLVSTCMVSWGTEGLPQDFAAEQLWAFCTDNFGRPSFLHLEAGARQPKKASINCPKGELVTWQTT